MTYLIKHKPLIMGIISGIIAFSIGFIWMNWEMASNCVTWQDMFTIPAPPPGC